LENKEIKRTEKGHWTTNCPLPSRVQDAKSKPAAVEILSLQNRKKRKTGNTKGPGRGRSLRERATQGGPLRSQKKKETVRKKKARTRDTRF